MNSQSGFILACLFAACSFCSRAIISCSQLTTFCELSSRLTLAAFCTSQYKIGGCYHARKIVNQQFQHLFHLLCRKFVNFLGGNFVNRSRESERFAPSLPIRDGQHFFATEETIYSGFNDLWTVKGQKGRPARQRVDSTVTSRGLALQLSRSRWPRLRQPADSVVNFSHDPTPSSPWSFPVLSGPDLV